jgi:hypothetical protein
LWVFCLFNGIFLTTVFLGGLWLSDLTNQIFGQRPLYVLGIPPEPLTVLVGNFILCGIWVWRYYIALALHPNCGCLEPGKEPLNPNSGDEFAQARGGAGEGGKPGSDAGREGLTLFPSAHCALWLLS